MGNNTERLEKQLTDPVEGRYFNYFKIGFNAFEFLLEFTQYYHDRDANNKTVMITNPIYAKDLLRVLQNSIDQYEKSFGVIKEGE